MIIRLREYVIEVKINAFDVVAVARIKPLLLKK